MVVNDFGWCGAVTIKTYDRPEVRRGLLAQILKRGTHFSEPGSVCCQSAFRGLDPVAHKVDGLGTVADRELVVIVMALGTYQEHRI